MGRDVINMVETATFFGLIMLACVTILVIGATALITLLGFDLAKDMWMKIRNK